MRKTAFVALVAFLCMTSLVQAAKPLFARDPSISPDGRQVCFVFDDDLWIVDFDGGDARRLTATEASEWGPQWSYDGKWIAFNSNRGGVVYPYLISPQGGEAQAIISEAYSVVEWFKDSDALLVTKYNPRFGSGFYKMSLDGSRPTLIAEVGDRFATLSPDNKSIVFNRYGYAYREAYTGSMSGNLWKIDIATKEYTQLTDGKYSYRYPRFSHSSGSLFYCQSDGERFQVFKTKNLNFKSPKQLSRLDRWSARDISVARDNERVVFEHFDEIYKYDPAAPKGQQVTRLDINIPEDMWQDNFRFDQARNDVSRIAVSENQKLMAFEYKYDAFIRPVKGGEPKRITFDQSGISSFAFMEDSRTLMIQKLYQGKEKLFTTSVDDPTNLTKVKWFGSDSLNVNRFYLDTSGKWVLYYDGAVMSSQVAIADSGFTNLRPINAPWPMISNLAFNDSQDFAAYAVVRPDYVYELYVYDFATQEHTKLMNMDGYVSNIGWTPDNHSLLLSMGGEIYRLDLVPRDQFEYDEDFWADALALDPEQETQTEAPGEEPEPPLEEAPQEEVSIEETPVEETPTEEPEVMEKTEPQEPEETEKPTLEIYWPGLKQRLVSILKDSEAYLYLHRMQGDNKLFYYSNGSRSNKNFILKSATIYGKDSKTELDFGYRAFNVVHRSGNYYYLSNGIINSCAIGAAPKEIPVDVDYEWDEATLNTRVFEEVWGVFGNNFYDPTMHGRDWQAMYDLYLPYAQQARNMDDLATVVEEMIGDVNASHTGFYPRRETERGRYNQTTYLGLDFDLENRLDKGLKVSFVYPHTRLDHYYKLQVGDLLTHIDGHEITAFTPVDSLLMNKVGKRIYLKLQREGEEIEADINGLSWSELRRFGYDHKIAKRRQMVEELTDSQVGYIHIPAMGTENYDQFTKELYTDNVDKKALIIDVRGNVGGRIHDMLITILIKKHYAYSTSRRRTYEPRPEPYSAWDKPSIVLVDEHSFSDGEIFPIVYQQLKLGKVVGYPSSGAVIGTWEYELVDGSSMRLPGSGWYKLDGTNMEGTGAMPDIIIQHTPNDIIADRDPQLQRAIEEILKEI